MLEMKPFMGAFYQSESFFHTRGGGKNEALDVVQKGAQYKYMGADEAKVVAEIDPSLFIDKNSITPDHSVIEEHTAKLKGIFYNFDFD